MSLGIEAEGHPQLVQFAVPERDPQNLSISKKNPDTYSKSPFVGVPPELLVGLKGRHKASPCFSLQLSGEPPLLVPPFFVAHPKRREEPPVMARRGVLETRAPSFWREAMASAIGGSIHAIIEQPIATPIEARSLMVQAIGALGLS